MTFNVNLLEKLPKNLGDEIINLIPKELDQSQVLQYLYLNPYQIVLTNKKNLLKHYSESLTKLEQKKSYLQEQIEAGVPLPKINDKLFHLFKNYDLRPYVIRYRVLHDVFLQAQTESNALVKQFYQNELTVVSTIINIIQLLQSKIETEPILDIERQIIKTFPYIYVFTNSISSESTFQAFTAKKVFYLNKWMKIVVYELSSFLSFQPPLFSNSTENRAFFCKFVGNALEYRKGETSYFHPLPEEDILFLFLSSKHSPLSINNLIPFRINEKSDVIKWTKSALTCLSMFEGSENQDRRDVIGVFVSRFVFQNYFFELQPHLTLDPKISTKMEKIQKMTPTELEIPSVYVPENLKNQSITEFFHGNSISKAPIDWLFLSQFQCCPIDIAYYINKAHESLTVLAGLNAAKDQEKDFFKKLPGFDDIFGFWVGAIAVSGVASPTEFSNYLSGWTGLPGMNQRFVLSCTYLSAVSSHLESSYNE